MQPKIQYDIKFSNSKLLSHKYFKIKINLSPSLSTNDIVKLTAGLQIEKDQYVPDFQKASVKKQNSLCLPPKYQIRVFIKSMQVSGTWEQN